MVVAVAVVAAPPSNRAGTACVTLDTTSGKDGEKTATPTASGAPLLLWGWGDSTYAALEQQRKLRQMEG